MVDATCSRAQATAASRATRLRPNSADLRHWDLPVERLSRLIEEHQFDLYNDPMPTMAALEGYINDTFSTLFSLAAEIAGWQIPEIEHLARHAGLAQGMARVVIAFPRDTSRRQLFLPLQLLERHGSGMEEAFAGKENPKVSAALDHLLGDARGHLDTALRLLEERAAGSKVGVPAAGPGGSRPSADVTRGHQSVRAVDHFEASDAVDIVAGVAVEIVLIEPAGPDHDPIRLNSDISHLLVHDLRANASAFVSRGTRSHFFGSCFGWRLRSRASPNRPSRN